MGPPGVKKTHLHNLLDDSFDLEVLKLSGHVQTAHMDFRDILPEHRLAKLRILELNCCEGNYSDFTNFLVLHEDSLRRVKLDNFNLRDGAWEDFRTFMPLHAPETSLVWGITWQDGSICMDYHEKLSVREGTWENVLFGTDHLYSNEDKGEWAGNDDQSSSGWPTDRESDSGNDESSSVWSLDYEFESGDEGENDGDIDLEPIARK